MRRLGSFIRRLICAFTFHDWTYDGLVAAGMALRERCDFCSSIRYRGFG